MLEADIHVDTLRQALTCCHRRKARCPPKAVVAGSGGFGAYRLRENLTAVIARSSASANDSCTRCIPLP